ncbi:oxidoreductase domain protein [Ferroglobus placidus DSM 10642]|uniref:Oxidoreductase domain protein n=2 Tax=Ferroglobus placidus TaxID=54261 RepID=D3S1M9_FERPA|nr:oxidoreductase domain protein [Ferroglobus placidus DSM 10642]
MIFGVLGVGVMGKNHVRVLNEIKKVDEVVIYDAKDERVKEVSKEFEVTPAASFEEFLSYCDAISICTPTSQHYEHIARCLKNGRRDKSIFVEKPIASCYKEGLGILKLIKGKELVFGVGHIERFNPIIREICDLDVEIEYVDIKRHNPSSSRVTDTTVVEDLMIHDIDIVFNVLLPNKDFRLSASGNKNIMHILAKFDDTVVSLSASRISSKKIRKIHIENHNLTIEGDYMDQELYIFRGPQIYRTVNEKYVQENVMEKVLINKVEPLKVELKSFVDCVNSGEDFSVTAEQAVNNLRICELIWKKAR